MADKVIGAAKAVPGMAGEAAAGLGGMALNWWRGRGKTQPSSPAPPVRAYRDDRRASQQAESRIAREEKKQGRMLTAKERLDIQDDETSRVLAANKRMHDRDSGVNDAQAEANRTETLMKSREAMLGRQLTPAERQKAFADVDAMSKAAGKTGADMDYRARYQEHFKQDKAKWQDGGHGLGRPDTVSVDDAQAEAMQTEALMKSRESMKGAPLTDAERQQVFADVDATNKAAGKTDEDMDYRKRYAEELGDPDPDSGPGSGTP
jgi:hypothetical protein